ncbi:MAG: hypothetical protein ABJK37_05450 [Paraglaciecola sp.]|uniref:hypothetical protein n=1 Tax=Paraglaciecola sp. TaxID=1920173 RepID=UPI0032982860
MSKNISLEEIQGFLNHQSKTSYSSVYLLEIHRRIFEITKLTIQLNYSSSYSNTLMMLEKLIEQLKTEDESGGVSYENVPLTPKEKNLIDELSVSLATQELKPEINRQQQSYISDFEY